MTNPMIKAMLSLIKSAPYNANAKNQFRSYSMRFLREVQERLGIEADIRFNPGGIAIPGDAILHGDHIYITFGGSGVFDWILYRTCQSRKDYTGGANHSFSFDRLRETGVQGFCAAVAQLLAKEGF